MKSLQHLLFLVLVGTISANSLKSGRLSSINGPECSKGMTFWCQNVINAKMCNAVDYCVKVVWETHLTNVDSNIICDDCKEWVGKARTFIENKDKSGEVIKSLKWTCDLIPLRPLADYCEKVVDENVPEILRMLESQMDPDVVCSKLFFCNNANYSKALSSQSESSSKLLPFTCGQCQHVGVLIEKKFSQADQDDVLEVFLQMCGEMSSYSDSCSSIVLTNFDDIYKGLRTTLKSKTICEMSASCLSHNHQREGIVDIVPPQDEADPSIPCELCQQLALHLRELLLTNTTEVEFKNIMIGFCHQMGQFSDECVTLTDQYYKFVYDFLSDKLNANKMCKAIGICPSQLSDEKLKMPTMPLVSSEIYPAPTSRVIEVQFEFDDASLVLYKNGSLCTTCSYVVHFLQETLRNQSTQEEIVDLMKKTCNEFPKKLQGECKVFVELYGDTIVSFLDQGLDPRYICSKIKLCPPNLSLEHLQKTQVDEKPTCPFCLFALQEIREMIETNKTKQNIEDVVSKLCNHLSDKLMSQCTEFVKKYANEVVEMLLADFSPQEACTFIKLCSEKHDEQERAKIIPNTSFTYENESTETISNPQCELCKEIVEIVEKRVINKKSKDEIRRELENSCSRLRKFSEKCKQFVDKYSDRIVDLIEKELEPKEVCKELMFCVNSDDFDSQDYDSGLDILMMAEKEPVEEIKQQPQCVLCEFIMTKLETELNDTKVDAEIKSILRSICSKLPSTIGKSCTQFVDYYFDMIIILIETMPPKLVCGEMKLCLAETDNELLTKIEEIQHDVFKCAMCKGLIESVDTIVEDPSADATLLKFEEKTCNKIAGKYRPKCHDFTQTYGIAIINHLKDLTDSDQICYQMNLCSWRNPSGNIKMTD